MQDKEGKILIGNGNKEREALQFNLKNEEKKIMVKDRFKNKICTYKTVN